MANITDSSQITDVAGHVQETGVQQHPALVTPATTIATAIPTTSTLTETTVLPRVGFAVLLCSATRTLIVYTSFMTSK